MSLTINLLADVMIAILLAATITTTLTLSQRIKRLKADEASMRKTITDLVMATDNAERAISGLRATLSECDRTLGERLRMAERYTADLTVQVQAGEGVMARIMQIIDASRLVAPPLPPKEQPPAVRLNAAASKAQALADRAMKRLEGSIA